MALTKSTPVAPTLQRSLTATKRKLPHVFLPIAYISLGALRGAQRRLAMCFKLFLNGLACKVYSLEVPVTVLKTAMFTHQSVPQTRPASLAQLIRYPPPSTPRRDCTARSLALGETGGTATRAPGSCELCIPRARAGARMRGARACDGVRIGCGE